MAELKQVTFSPEVLARIAPDVSLQRHLALGVRPNLRNFTEFKPVEVSNSTQFKTIMTMYFHHQSLKAVQLLL